MLGLGDSDTLIDANYTKLPDNDNDAAVGAVEVGDRPPPRQRWLILFLYCMCGIQQDMAWLVLSPIQSEMGTGMCPEKVTRVHGTRLVH